MASIGYSKVFWNFLVFAIIQTVFFYYVISDFVFNIIDDKVQSIGGIMTKQMSQSQLNNLKQQLEKDISASKDNIDVKSAERDNNNIDFLMKTIGPLIAGGLFVFAFTFWGAWNSSVSITGTDYAVFGVILGSYLTEVALFFIMMNRYEFIGTVEILKAINKKLTPLTPANVRNLYQ